MTRFYLFQIVLVTLFSTTQLTPMSAQENIEMYPYSVKKTYDDFEIRNYEASLFTAVELPTDNYDEASNMGFSILAGYIFGGNESKEKIAMTSPVAMSLEEKMTMMFMVPKEYSKASLPKPNSSQIEFEEVPEKTVAAITFGGWADDEKIEKHKKLLVAALKKEGIAHTDHFYFLGYNAPNETTNRRNEVIVELE